MNRRKFIGIAGGTILAAGTTSYLLSDKSNFARADIKPAGDANETLLLKENTQIILQTDYLKNYPPPVSLRRPVDWFMS